MKRELLLSSLIINHSSKELNSLSDDELMDMWQKLHKKIGGDW